MLDITLKELRDQEYANVETTCNEIAEKLSERAEIRPYTVFAAAYLSYLVADNELENEEKLLDYIEKELPLDQLLFVKESVENSWSVVMKIGNLYTKERLLATVLWMPMSDRRMGYQQETPESIINLAIKILSINNEKVADFCCGKGAFLAKALEEDEKSEYYGIEIETHCKEISNIRLALASKNGYRALIEATAYGTRMIIDVFREYGVDVNSFYAAGGISQKDPMTMQIYADVM